MTVRTLPTRRPTTPAVKDLTLDGWQQHGLCRTEDPDLFFPTGSSAQAVEQTAKAKQVCARCPVIETCFRWAVDTRQDIGVLGGLSENERRNMHRRKARMYGRAELPAAQQILNYRMDEFKAAQERGLSEAEIALELGTNVQTVNNVLEALVTAAVEAESRPDLIAVRNYLAGVDDGILPRDRLAAIVDGVRRGMTYPQFDAMHGLTKGATSTFMSRTRKAFEARGEAFPDLGRQCGVRILTDAQVIAIRERCAAGGATDMDVSISFGVSRKTVTDVARGKTYRNVGGPLRVDRKDDPSAEQRVVWAGGTPVSEGSMSSMGEAA